MADRVAGWSQDGSGAAEAKKVCTREGRESSLKKARKYCKQSKPFSSAAGSGTLISNCEKIGDHQINVALLSRTYGARSAGRLCLSLLGHTKNPPLSRGCAAVASDLILIQF
jgi:hypothetical protein